MKILWITIESILPANSGGRIGIFRRLEQIQNNNDIYLFYTMDSVDDKKYQTELLNYCTEVHGYLRKKISISTLFNLLKAPFTVASRFNSRMVSDINKCIIENQIDLINVDSPHMGLNLYKINRVGIPVVLNQHNIEWMVYKNIANSNDNIIKKFIYSFDSIRFKRFEKRLYNKISIDTMTFVSTEDMEYINKAFPHIKTELVPVGGISKNFQYSWNSNNNNIVFVGKMSYAPNAEAAKWFIKSIFPIIKRVIPNANIFVVGKDPDDELKSLSSDSITITGMVDSVDVYYKKAGLVVVPLKHGGGVKVKLLEAIGNKVPVISTSIGVQGTMFNSDNMIVADSTEEFANKCIAFLENRNDYESMYKRVFSIFEKEYTWEAIGKKYNKILCNVTEQK